MATTSNSIAYSVFLAASGAHRSSYICGLLLLGNEIEDQVFLAFVACCYRFDDGIFRVCNDH